jgi:hypothetical protein
MDTGSGKTHVYGAIYNASMRVKLIRAGPYYVLCMSSSTVTTARSVISGLKH